MQNENGTFEKVMETVSKIESEVSKHIIGQKEIIRQVLMCMLAGGNVLLEGMPGLGKTRLVNVLGKVMGLKFSRIQFTPDLMPADVTGTNIIDRESVEEMFRFQPGPIFSNIVLADEINRATPKTQSAMLQAMQEKTVTVANTTYKLPEPFFVLATQNPIEMEGTYPLPEAQMDRFLFKLNVPSPDFGELKDIIKLTTTNREDKVETVTNAEEIILIQKAAREIPIAEPVLDYAIRLVIATRPDGEGSPEMVKKYVRYGSSPRGAQAIISTARIRALLCGRYNVSFEDIKNVAYPSLRHRIFVNFDAVSDGISPDMIIDGIIGDVKIYQ
ncbi:ATPase, AAA family [Thermoclostridium stercorarium subsp. stercorarium DSM 8532]|uniref:ATPase, AAA family n=2 Tax=Thermoclostridium stercorarium TaxID=1510 RepID=L7VSJ0_THES1|nr:MoxR family ATPase [Thermoclostridium stercorarium]AGC68523.1 ATPase, AAA family [Thermoclostridium stercorarium subsp. stercorarium DSM 8532]AGI39539.1 ATPase [Thermoclostridium stercorarium subsp. stercorarium DSM 8532]UZQ84511.1 MoxR family ATPase [Thermoclostridium stercorarium]